MRSQHGGEAGDDQLLEAVIVVVLALVGLTFVVYVAADLASFAVTGAWRQPSGDGAGRFVGAVADGRSLSEAWSGTTGTPGAQSWLIGVTALLLLAPIGGIAYVVRTRFRSGHDADVARWAGVADERRITVPRQVARRANRIVAGTSKSTGRRLAGEDCVSAVVIGPNGAGKTVGLIIPNTLEWQGSVVMTTAKPQDLVPVLRARRSQGPVWVVGPGGVPGVATASWSPVDYAKNADAADRMAGWLVDASGMTGDARSRPWNAQARKYLKGLLLSAHLSGGGIHRFIEWAYDGELASDHVCQVLSEHGHVEVLREYRSTWRIHEEGKGSVLFTAFGLADTYNRPGVLDSSSRSDFAVSDLLAETTATLLLVMPQSEVERFTPYFTALISAIVHEAEQRAAQTGGPISPRLLLALDEAGNVFRYPRLPHLLTTARGNGVQLLLAYHDLAQIEHLFGGRDVARTILSNAKLRVLLPGVGDVETLRYFSELLGQTKVSVGSRQTSPNGRRSRSEAEHREALAPLHLLQQMPAWEALLLYENLPPSRVKLRRWFNDRDLLRLTRCASPDLASTAAGGGDA